ncbi:MAG: SRPBCC domain-containing protein [Gemmatimonadota bacterium]
MASAATTQDLEVRRSLDATPERVFAAWTQAQALASWFAPSERMTTLVHALDARLGGEYRIEMREPNGTPHIVSGTYTAFDAPRYLAFTWQWEKGDGEQTLVEVELQPSPAGTELLLRHSRHASIKSRDGHAAGWEGCLTRLTTHFTPT